MTPIEKCSGISRIVQRVQGPTVRQFDPEQIAFVGSLPRSAGKEQSLFSKSLYRSHCRSSLLECFKEAPQAVLDLLVRVQHRLLGGVIYQAHWQRRLQLTTPRFVQNATLQPRSDDMQLGLAHRALQSEQ